MGQLTFQATLGGAVNLAGPNTAATTTFTLPAADGSSGQALTTNASGTLAFANIPLASAVSGTLPIANGGTGTTSTTFANLTTNVTGTLPIANGGTNSTATPTAGGVVYGTGTAQAVTSAGSSGQVLTSAGAGAPTWASPAGGGSWIFLSTVTASNSATVNIETTFDSTYQNYVIVASAVIASSSGQTLLVRQRQSGTYQSSTYKWHLNQSYNQSSSYQGVSANSGTSYTISDYVSNSGSDQGVNLVMYVLDPANSSTYKGVFCTGYSNSDNINIAGMNCTMLTGVCQNSTAALTGIRFLMSSGNISSGTFRLYGIKNS